MRFYSTKPGADIQMVRIFIFLFLGTLGSAAWGENTINTHSYALGYGQSAEYRLELLNEIYHERMHHEIIKHVPMSSVKIFTIGCGSAHLEAKLNEIASNSNFYGVDISPERISEANRRTANINQTSNSFRFAVKDITKDDLGKDEFDIIISRFVLSHLPNPVEKLKKVLNNLSPGGTIILEELVATDNDFLCRGKCEGYRMFSESVKVQRSAQGGDHLVAFDLMDYLQKNNFEIISTFMQQPILRTSKSKSILRLGIEESGNLIINHFGKQEYERIKLLLRDFEDDPSSYALYARSMGIIARKKSGVAEQT